MRLRENNHTISADVCTADDSRWTFFTSLWPRVSPEAWLDLSGAKEQLPSSYTGDKLKEKPLMLYLVPKHLIRFFFFFFSFDFSVICNLGMLLSTIQSVRTLLLYELTWILDTEVCKGCTLSGERKFAFLGCVWETLYKYLQKLHDYWHL